MAVNTDLKAQLLLSALECTAGDVRKTFTFEELLVKAWEKNPHSWGLRGFEEKHPDSERIHREVDSRGGTGKGLVGLGLLEKVQTRVYRLTPKGLAEASRISPERSGFREKAGRQLEEEISRILEHPCFQSWLQDPHKPQRFREAGSFWGIAPGTPEGAIKQRIQRVEDTLKAAQSFLAQRDVVEIATGRGHLLFEAADIERCMEFQRTMKLRFAAEFKVLGVTFE